MESNVTLWSFSWIPVANTWYVPPMKQSLKSTTFHGQNKRRVRRAAPQGSSCLSADRRSFLPLSKDIISGKIFHDLHEIRYERS